MHADPPFERVVVYHVDPDGSEECSVVDGAEVMGELPQITDFDPAQKSLLVLEDVDLEGLKPAE